MIKTIETHPVPPPKGRIFTFSSPSGATISSCSPPPGIIVPRSAKSIESRNRGSIYESRGATSDVFIWLRVQANSRRLLSLSISFPRYLLLSFSVRTTHVQAIRYDWLDPRFRTNHFIKAPVLNKPAFDYSPRATLSLSSLIPSPSFAPTDRIVSLHRRTNYLVVYPAATDHRLSR